MIVIGVGDPSRRDDGVGPAVVSLLRWRGLPGVTLAESDGDAADLLALWTGHDFAVVVDGVDTGRVGPGRLHRLSLHHPSLAGGGSGPGRPELGLAVQLSRTLDRLPPRLLFFAVEVVDVAPGKGLSPVVAAAARAVADEIAELCRAGAPVPAPAAVAAGPCQAVARPLSAGGRRGRLGRSPRSYR
jgi:hydrogenase maturation protease